MFVTVLGCGFLLALAYFIYYRFIKVPASLKKSKISGSPKGQELQANRSNSGYDKLDDDEEEHKSA